MKWLVLVALAACSPPERAPAFRAAGASTPQRGGTLRVASKDAIATLDLAIAYDEVSFIALRLVHETLLDYAPGSTELVPRLAERYAVSADAKTYTFWLRKDAMFSDGTAIVAADIAYALERARTTPDSLFGQMIGDITAVSMPDPHTLVVDLAQPNAGFATMFTMPFTAPQRPAAAGVDVRRTPLASGPYTLVAWDEGVRLVFERNAAYTGGRTPYVDRIELLENVPRDTQFLMFERGELDLFDRPSPPDRLWLLAQPGWQPYVQVRPILNVYGARFDVTQPPFTDRRVRQAFNYAVDKAHTTKLLAGSTVPAHGILPPGVFGRDDALAPYPRDVSKARALLADAGYPDGLSVELVTIADDEAEKIAVSMQSDLADVGVRLRISLVPGATYLSMVGKRGGPAFAFAGWVGDSPDPTNFLDAKFHSRGIADEGAVNDAYYANPELDALLDAARADADPVSRAARYRRAEAIVYADAPWLWNYHQVITEVTQPYVRDYQPHPVWIRDLGTAWLDLGPGGERLAR